MKKQRFPLLLFLTLACVFLTLGFFLGRTSRQGEITLAIPLSMQTAPTEALAQPTRESAPDHDNRVNINTATEEELMTLPGIGEVYARRILDYRKKNGSFSSVDQLLNVPGIGEKRLEALLDYITVGGTP